MKTATVSLLISLAMVAGVARAGAVLQGGSETTGASYLANFMNGYDFTSTTAQSLTALGFWDQGANGLPRSFQVGVWFTATQTLLASATIDNADPIDPSVTIAGGNYRYESLLTPVALTAGSTYTLGWQIGPGTLSGLDSLFINYPTLAVDPNVTVPNQGRFRETGAFTFPTGAVTADGFFRGMVNAQVAVVPEPSALLSAVLAVGLLGGGRLLCRKDNPG